MNNEIVTQANTKLIAAWMGLDVEEYNECIYVKNQFCGESWNRAKYFMSASTYNPITNADQRFEILEKLIKMDYEPSYECGKYFISIEESIGYFKAETLPLAIYKVALYEANKTTNTEMETKSMESEA